MILLLLSGDVELNPGPTNQEMLAQILASNQKVSKDIEDIKSSQLNFDSAIAKINDRLSGIEQTIGELRNVAKQFEECQADLVRVKDTISILEGKIDDLENRSRRNNLIVYGISEAANESFEELKKLVCEDIFDGLLNVTTASLERIHRLGKPQRNKTRPVIVRFFDFNDKVNVLKNARKLKGKKISISEDFSKRIQSIRKCLWDSASANRASGDKVRLVYDKLFINNDAYVWDSVKNEKLRLRSPHPDSYAALAPAASRSSSA